MGAPFSPQPAPAGSLAGLQWLLPWQGPWSVSPSDPNIRECPATATQSAVMSGPTGNSYDVTLRFQGKVEKMSYTGGSNDGALWQIGGSPDLGNPSSSGSNIYKLQISSPAQTYYLNRGTTGFGSMFTIDYTKTIQIDVGATVTLSADANNGATPGELSDGSGDTPTISVSGVTNPAQPYAGQFINMTVTNVVQH